MRAACGGTGRGQRYCSSGQGGKKVCKAELRGDREAEGSKGNHGEGTWDGRGETQGKWEEIRRGRAPAAGGELGEEPLGDSAGRGWLGAWTEEQG